MMKTMFCPNCGAGNQAAESYCRNCGEWLPDLNALVKRKLFGKLSREQKIEKIRVLEIVSAGLSLTSAAIVLSILAGGDRQMLFLAALCSILVTVYQFINLYLGYKIQHKNVQSRIESKDEIALNAGTQPKELNAVETARFAEAYSATEDTTGRLEPELILRDTKRDK